MTGEAGHNGRPGTVRQDPATVGALWREHRRWVAAVLLAHMPRESELEDLLQEVAVVLVARVGELRDPGALRPWLRTVAINTARMAARNGRARRERTSALDDGAEPLPDPASERAVLLSDARAEVREVLALARALPEEYREPLLLRCVRGLSQKQIAAALELPETTVETRLARARRLLRTRLEERNTPRTARAPRAAAPPAGTAGVSTP